MATGHDKKCPRCKGAGERLVYIPFEITPEMEGQDAIAAKSRIIECALCGGTGLVELDEDWEHA